MSKAHLYPLIQLVSATGEILWQGASENHTYVRNIKQKFESGDWDRPVPEGAKLKLEARRTKLEENFSAERKKDIDLQYAEL